MKKLSPSALCLTLFLTSGWYAAAQEARGKAALDQSSLTPSVERLTGIINEAVESAGGNLDHQNAHWVFAFSTGHYKSDPLGAQAAREFVGQFVDSNVVSGDRITSAAWELQTWQHKVDQGTSLQIGADAQEDKARAANLWPTTPAVGSIGGHDTERVAVDLASQLERDAGVVLVLVTNTAASVGAAGHKLLGTNAPEYEALLGNWTRLRGENARDGATLVVPYVVTTPNGNRNAQLETVVFVPKAFTSAQIGTATRTELIAQEKAPATPVKQENTGSGAGFLGVLLGLAALGGVGYGAYRLFGTSQNRATLRVEGQTFNLSDYPNNRPVCILAGPGYASEDDTPVVPVQGAPSEKFAELSRVGKDIRVRSTSDVFELKEVNGAVVTGSTILKLRPETPDHILEFSGDVKAASGVPRNVIKTINVALTQGEA